MNFSLQIDAMPASAGPAVERDFSRAQSSTIAGSQFPEVDIGRHSESAISVTRVLKTR